MSGDDTAGRDEIVAMLASFGDRSADAVPETIDSMELAWLLHQVEQRHGLRVDLDDGRFTGITTVSEAVDVLGSRLNESGDGDDTTSGRRG